MAFISNRTGKSMDSSTDKNPDQEALLKKKKDRKSALLFILFVAVLFTVIWFGLEFLATEHPISQTQITVAGKDRVLKFSEKTRGYTEKRSTGERESGTSHYGYFLELVDSLNKRSLHKLKFKAPVHNIQDTPKMYIASNGTIWLVSTTNGFREDEPGFILKFSINNDSIKQIDYELDDIYGIRQIKDNNVMLSKGNEFYQACNPVFGCVYLDLETEKVIDDRKK